MLCWLPKNYSIIYKINSPDSSEIVKGIIKVLLVKVILYENKKDLKSIFNTFNCNIFLIVEEVSRIQIKQMSWIEHHDYYNYIQHVISLRISLRSFPFHFRGKENIMN